MMKSRHINLKIFSISIIFLFLLIGFVGSVYAITGSIGNARMILRVDQGDTIERYILVKNVNDESLNIEVTGSGDLKVDIKDDVFTLGPNEDKKAYFTIKVNKAGTTESKINVKFSPIDGGNGVGLSSTVIIIAEEKEGFFEGLFGGDDANEDTGDSSDDSEDVVVSFGKKDDTENIPADSETGNTSSNKKSINSLFVITTITTLILFVVLIVLASLTPKLRKNIVKSKKKVKKG